MLRTELVKRLEALELSQKDFAELIGYNYQTVKQWKDGKIPKWVPMLLDYFESIRHQNLLAQKYGLHFRKKVYK